MRIVLTHRRIGESRDSWKESGMDKDTSLAAITLLLGWAIPFGWEAVTARGWRRYGAGGLAAFFILWAVFWNPLARALPGLATAVSSLAAEPVTWYVLFVFAVALTIFTGPQFWRGQKNVATQPATITDDQLRDVNLDLVHLQHFAVDTATFIAVKRLADNAPMGEIPLNEGTDRREDMTEALKRFIREAEQVSGGFTGDAPILHNAMHQAEREADDELARRLTENHELTKIMNQLRDKLRLEMQRDAALKFLHRRLLTKEEDIAKSRNGLIERMWRRSPP